MNPQYHLNQQSSYPSPRLLVSLPAQQKYSPPITMRHDHFIFFCLMTELGNAAVLRYNFGMLGKRYSALTYRRHRDYDYIWIFLLLQKTSMLGNQRNYTFSIFTTIAIFMLFYFHYALNQTKYTHSGVFCCSWSIIR